VDIDHTIQQIITSSNKKATHTLHPIVKEPHSFPATDVPASDNEAVTNWTKTFINPVNTILADPKVQSLKWEVDNTVSDVNPEWCAKQIHPLLTKQYTTNKQVHGRGLHGRANHHGQGVVV
jgi:hypothetical protein